MSSNNNRNSRTRSRSVKRCFTLLRFCDTLRVPRANVQRTLESSGRSKELEFANNATTEATQEMLLHSFEQFLTREEAHRLKFYRTVSGSTLLTLAGSWIDVCGETLKHMYRNRTKVFMKIDQAATITNGDGTDRDGSLRDEGESSRRTEQDENATRTANVEQDRPPSDDGFPHHDEDSGLLALENAWQSIVEISDDEDPRSAVPRGNTERSNGPRISVPGASELSSTPICGHRVRGVEHARLDAETFVSRLFDKVIDVPMTTHTCMGDTWEKTAVQVGEVEEEPDLLTAAELDARSGASFDACVLKRFLAANRVPQRLPVLCLTPSELQLQSYSDVTPVCIIRYRLTSQALEALRTLMTSEEAIRALEKCNVHFSLMGSDFDLEVCGKEKLLVNSGHLDAHILQPTISCTRLVVGDIIEGNTEDLATNLTAAVEDAIQASSIVRSQRELLQQQRELKQRQDKEYSELLERENVRTQQDQQQQVLENSESEFDRTVQDTEQVRQKRLRFLEKEVEQSKRPREDIYDNDNDEDSSRIVTFPGINRDNIASQ